MTDLAGYEGNVLLHVSTRISTHRVDRHNLRCRPGDFTWRYAKRQTNLYHAGNQFARLWERAGISIASSADFLRGTSCGYPTGIANGRVAAIDKLKRTISEIGRFSTERLIDYCVLGHTTAELARKYARTERGMAAALEQDLRSCADALRYS